MDQLDQMILPYLKHVMVVRGVGCTCPVDGWAPCGGQYAGHYDVACPHHGPGRLGIVESHFPTGCPAR